MCPTDFVTAHHYPSGRILLSPPDYLELKADLQLCRKPQAVPPRAPASFSSPSGNGAQPSEPPCGFWSHAALRSGRRGREVARTAPFQAQIASLAKKTLWIFQPGPYNVITLCREGGGSVPRTPASWHCRSQGTTNAGAFGKRQFGLTQHCHKTAPCPILQSEPCYADRYLWFFSRLHLWPVASEHAKRDAVIVPWLQGKSALQTPLSLRRLLGMQLALLKKAELSCCGLLAQVSQGVQKAADLGPASIFNF